MSTKNERYTTVEEFLESTETGKEATITSEQGEYQPYRVEVENSGQGHYFRTWYDAHQFAVEQVEAK